MKNCTANLPVSKYVERKVKYIAPKADRYLIYNCMNLTDAAQTNIVKENIVLTVAIIDNERTFSLKGMNTFIETARLLPQYRFVIVGFDKSIVNHLIKELPGNVIIYDKIPHHELINYYQKAKIYCQFSLTESFGVSIAEAMFYNCIPIVTNEGAMPEIVGDWGQTVKRDTGKIATSIEKILTSVPDNNQKLMANYIRTKFSPELRKEKLLAVFNKE
jgi:glycosyltransferase involved in cell wall biosynthesis